MHRYIQVISHTRLLCKQGLQWMLIDILKPHHLHSREWGKIIPELYLNFLSKIKTRKRLSWNKRGFRRRDWLCLNPCFPFTLARLRKLLIHSTSGFFMLSPEMVIRALSKGHGDNHKWHLASGPGGQPGCHVGAGQLNVSSAGGIKSEWNRP